MEPNEPGAGRPGPQEPLGCPSCRLGLGLRVRLIRTVAFRLLGSSGLEPVAELVPTHRFVRLYSHGAPLLDGVRGNAARRPLSSAQSVVYPRCDPGSSSADREPPLAPDVGDLGIETRGQPLSELLGLAVLWFPRIDSGLHHAPHRVRLRPRPAG